MSKIFEIFWRTVNVLFRVLTLVLLGDGLSHAASSWQVVPLAPSLAEWYCELRPLCEDEIIGVTEYTDYPPGLKKKTSIGPYHQIHLETLIQLRPNLVLATSDGNSQPQLAKLKKLGLKILIFDMRSLTDIPLGWQRLGDFLGEKESAQRQTAAFEQGLQKLKTAYAKKKKRVALILGESPLVAAGGQGYLSEALPVIGLENIYSNLSEAYPKISYESLIQRKPDLVIVLGLGDGLQEAKKIARSLPKVPQVLLSGEKLARPTLRLVTGLQELAEKAWASP